LGPVLFLLYINDIYNSSTLLRYFLFADDTTILYSHDNLDYLINTINKELTLLSGWFRANKLSLNLSKTTYMLFKNHKIQTPSSSILFDDIPIKKVATTRFLGVEIDEKLTWKNHIQHIEKKISSTIFILKKIRHKINPITAFKLYDTLILSHLTYCNIIWSNTYSTYTKHLFTLQKRALRICYYPKIAPTSDQLFKLTNKLPLSDLQKMQISKIIFQYFNSPTQLPTTIANLF